MVLSIADTRHGQTDNPRCSGSVRDSGKDRGIGMGNLTRQPIAEGPARRRPRQVLMDKDAHDDEEDPNEALKYGHEGKIPHTTAASASATAVAAATAIAIAIASL